MRGWLFRSAQTHFSDLVTSALSEGPQRVSCTRQDSVVVVSDEEWRRQCAVKSAEASFGEFLMEFPDIGQALPERRRFHSQFDTHTNGTYLADADVVMSLGPFRRTPGVDPSFAAWIDQYGGQIFLSTMTVAKLVSVATTLGRKRGRKKVAKQFEEWIYDLSMRFTSRVIPASASIGHRAGRRLGIANRGRAGSELHNAVIGATAFEQGLTLLSRDTTGFAKLGFEAYDPFSFVPVPGLRHPATPSPA